MESARAGAPASSRACLARGGAALAASLVLALAGPGRAAFADDPPAPAAPAGGAPTSTPAAPAAPASPAAPSPPAAPAAPSDADVVAVVDGRPLTRGDFERYLVRMLGESYLPIFINEALVEAEAARHGIAATAETEAAWIEDKIARMKASPDYRDVVGDGYDYDELRRQYRPHARTGFLLESLIKRERSGEAELLREYDRRFGPRLKARHLLYAVTPPANADEAMRAALDKEARAKADRALELLKKGVEFEELARRESEDPGSARRGGLLPEFGRGDMVGPFEEAAFALAPRAVSAPVRSPFGWHVIQVLEVFPAARPLDDALRGELGRELIDRPVSQEELARYLEALRARAKVEVRFP